MRYFPIQLDVKDRNVVVIGGGIVATRKVLDLLRAGPKVLVIAKEASWPLVRLHRQKKLRLVRRPYRSGDLKGAFLVVAATDDAKIHGKIRREAVRRRILLNVVDGPSLCDFVFPAKVVRGDFVVSIGTGGHAPALARLIRIQLEKQFGKEYGYLTEQMGRLRRRF